MSSTQNSEILLTTDIMGKIQTLDKTSNNYEKSVVSWDVNNKQYASVESYWALSDLNAKNFVIPYNTANNIRGAISSDSLDKDIMSICLGQYVRSDYTKALLSNEMKIEAPYNIGSCVRATMSTESALNGMMSAGVNHFTHPANTKTPWLVNGGKKNMVSYNTVDGVLTAMSTESALNGMMSVGVNQFTHPDNTKTPWLVNGGEKNMVSYNRVDGVLTAMSTESALGGMMSVGVNQFTHPDNSKTPWLVNGGKKNMVSYNTVDGVLTAMSTESALEGMMKVGMQQLTCLDDTKKLWATSVHQKISEQLLASDGTKDETIWGLKKHARSCLEHQRFSAHVPYGVGNDQNWLSDYNKNISEPTSFVNAFQSGVADGMSEGVLNVGFHHNHYYRDFGTIINSSSQKWVTDEVKSPPTPSIFAKNLPTRDDRTNDIPFIEELRAPEQLLQKMTESLNASLSESNAESHSTSFSYTKGEFTAHFVINITINASNIRGKSIQIGLKNNYYEN